MYSRGRYVRSEHQLTLLLAAVLAGVGAYVPVDRGAIPADIIEILLPVCVSVGLLFLTLYVRRQRFESEQIGHIVKLGWAGALAAGAIGGWWVAVHWARELPVWQLNDQLVTVWTLGIGAGVLVGMYTVRRRTFERDADRERVLAETAWTNRSGPDPVLETIVEAIAEIEGVDPLEVGPIYDHVDPDIVADLRNQTDSHWQLLFYTDDYEVRVTSQGTVTVYDTDVSADGPATTASSELGLSDWR